MVGVRRILGQHIGARLRRNAPGSGHGDDLVWRYDRTPQRVRLDVTWRSSSLLPRAMGTSPRRRSIRGAMMSTGGLSTVRLGSMHDVTAAYLRTGDQTPDSSPVTCGDRS